MRPRHYIPMILLLLPGVAVAAGEQDSLAQVVARDSVLHFPLPPLWGSILSESSRASVFTSDSLRWIAGRWAGEVFSLQGALRSLEESTEGGYAQFFLRGGDQRGIGFYRNGRPIGEPGSEAFNPYHLQWEEYALAEIVTGPRAFLNGLDHPAASVNFVSREWDANKPFTRILYAEGGDDYAYSDGTFAQNVSRRVGVTAGFQHIGLEGGYTNSMHEQWNIRGSLRVHLAQGWLASLSGNYLTTNTGLNGGVDLSRSGGNSAFNPTGATVVNSDSYEKRERQDFDLSIVGSSTEDSSVTTRLTFYHTDSFREYRDEENRRDPNGITVAANHRMRRTGVDGSQIFTAGPIRIEAGAGVENLSTVDDPNLGDRSFLRPSLHGLSEFAPSGGIRVGLFGRIERFDQETGVGMGGDCALELTPGLTLFAGVSRSERIPGIWEKYWSDSTVTRSAPLVLEQHTLAEAGFEARVLPHSTLRVALFHKRVEHPVRIVWSAGGSPFGRLSIANAGTASMSGIDATASAGFWYLLVEGAGTFQFSSSGEQSPERFPKVILSGGIYCRGNFFDGNLDLRAGVRGRYSSSSSGDRFNPEALAWGEDAGSGTGGWSSVDGVLSARIGAAHIHLVWENLTNVDAFTARYYPLRQRGIRFGLAWEFMN